MTRSTTPRPFFTLQVLLFTAVCSAAAVSPVLIDPTRARTPRFVWLIAVLCYRWLEQTVFRPSPVVGQRTGEWLFLPIYLGVSGSVVLPAIESAFLPRPVSWAVLTIGVVMAALGTILRYASINALGEQLSTHIEVRPDHKLIETGPFRFVRHPGTTGAVLLFVGAALILQAYYSLIYILGFLGTLLLIRVFVEEQHSAALLPGYRDYMTRTKRLIPFVL